MLVMSRTEREAIVICDGLGSASFELRIEVKRIVAPEHVELLMTGAGEVADLVAQAQPPLTSKSDGVWEVRLSPADELRLGDLLIRVDSVVEQVRHDVVVARARLGFEAPASWKVHREEVYEAVTQGYPRPSR